MIELEERSLRSRAGRVCQLTSFHADVATSNSADVRQRTSSTRLKEPTRPTHKKRRNLSHCAISLRSASTRASKPLCMGRSNEEEHYQPIGDDIYNDEPLTPPAKRMATEMPAAPYRGRRLASPITRDRTPLVVRAHGKKSIEGTASISPMAYRPLFTRYSNTDT